MSQAGAARPRRRNDPETVRRRILDAAVAAFQTGGYHSTSTHEIMRLAAVTSGALHHHFATKKSLGLAIIRERVAQAIEDTWVRPVTTADSVTDGILAAFDQISGSIEKRGEVYGCPLNNLSLELSAADADFQSALNEVFVRWQSAIGDRLRADQAVGRLGQFDADALATFVVAAYSGAMAMAKTSQSSAPLRVCAQQLKRILEA
jgi:AcrR family transcriptional regulator